MRHFVHTLTGFRSFLHVHVIAELLHKDGQNESQLFHSSCNFFLLMCEEKFLPNSSVNKCRKYREKYLVNSVCSVKIFCFGLHVGLTL